MLKNSSIIQNMTRLQKIALITDFFGSLQAGNNFGIPAVKVASLETLNEADSAYPSFENMACSWNTELIGRVVADLAARARDTGVKLISTPDLKTATNPYVKGLSEDPYFNGAIGDAMMNSIHSVGAACSLAHFAVKDEDVEYLDLRKNDRAIHELFVAPFVYATEKGDCDAVTSSLAKIKSGYHDCNTELFSDLVSGRVLNNAFAISEKTPSSVDYHSFLAGKACLSGATLSLNEAVDRYNKLVESVNDKSTPESALRGAIAEGSAIDEATLDGAVDRIIDFAYYVNGLMPSRENNYTVTSELAIRAAQESIVMLKNQKALPLVGDTKIALIGDADMDLSSFASRFNVVGQVAGYDSRVDRSDFMISDALRVSEKADTIVLFLRVGDCPNSAKLPANRRALIAALGRARKQMIAVLVGNIPTDASIENAFSAILFAPKESDCVYEALGRILSGNVSPSGKLTRTFYAETDEHFNSVKSDRDAHKVHIGPFVGYRYYDTVDKQVGYPFGFGLSYTKFEYSNLQIEENSVSFTIQNVGNVAAYETAQIYVGNVHTAYITPRKELKAFKKVFLKVGEVQRVTVKIPRTRLASYNEGLTAAVEQGNYTVYVGASSQDVRLKGVMAVEGKVREKSGERPEHYFIDVSNVNAGFRFGAIERDNGITWRKIMSDVLFGGFLVLTFLAVLLMFNMLTSESLTFWHWFTLFVFIGLAILAFILHFDQRENVVGHHAVKRKNPFNYDDTIVINAATPEEIFNLAFEDEEIPSDIGDGRPAHFDKAVGFDSIYRDVHTLLSERGIDVSDNELRNLIAAVSTTQLLIVAAEDEKLLVELCKALGEYFGKETFTDSADSYSSSMIFNQWQSYRGLLTDGSKFGTALSEARRENRHVQVALINHVKTSSMSELLTPFVEAVGKKQSAVNNVVVPPNLLCIASLDKGEALSAVPPEIAEIAACIVFKARACAVNDNKTPVKPLSYDQLAGMSKRARDTYPLEESLWKRIDLLEEQVNKARAYRISNKTCLKLEKHTAVFTACGGEASSALDGGVAAYVLAQIAQIWDAELCEAELRYALTEIFGKETEFIKEFVDRILYEVKDRSIENE